VNRHVDGKGMKFSDLVSLINKRAPEWRKTLQSPGNKGKKKQKVESSGGDSHFKVSIIMLVGL
jgi:hypothetical protein